jgi:BlaI family penicillinase repressor
MLKFQHMDLMAKNREAELSRRERQIMDIVHRQGRVTAAEVMDALADPPSYSAVRAALRLLEERGHVKHETDRNRYVYSSTISREKARDSALKHVIRTFFEGSTEQVANALFANPAARLSKEELDRIARIIERARKKEDGK